MEQRFVCMHGPAKKLLLQHPNIPDDVKRQLASSYGRAALECARMRSAESAFSYTATSE